MGSGDYYSIPPIWKVEIIAINISYQYIKNNTTAIEPEGYIIGETIDPETNLIFDGWFLKNLQTGELEPYDWSTPITSNIRISALWVG